MTVSANIWMISLIEHPAIGTPPRHSNIGTHNQEGYLFVSVRVRYDTIFQVIEVHDPGYKTYFYIIFMFKFSLGLIESHFDLWYLRQQFN